MYKFFQRNQKKLLAIFGAFLMVVFILPSTFKSGSSGRENPVVAYIGDEKIRAVEAAQARADWAAIRRIAVRVAPFQQAPYPYVKLGRLAATIEQSPELFLLLQKEALRQGIRISPDRVDNVVLNELDMPGLNNPDDRERQRHAAEAILLVETLYNRVLDNVKVSQPRVERELALNEQEVRLDLVEFSASDYEKSTTAPTTQEVQEQFRRYAGVLPGQPTTAPSAGTLEFGYKYPNRVKLQYLTIGKDQVRQAIKKSKSDYDWEVAAQRYYQTHLNDFPVTQPTAQPLGPAAPLAIPQPTTRPFAEVREQVMEKVMQPEEARLMSDIRSAVQRRLASAWEQQSRAAGGKPTSGPATATAPATTQPSGNGSFAYLEQLAADIQKQFGMLPAVTSKAEQWLTAEDLSKLPGIGAAWRESDKVSFPNYVVQSAEAFMPVPAKADPSSVLSILEPSDPLSDVGGNVYLFRLTDAQAAHAPSDVAEVKDKVESDVRAGRAYGRAMEDAKKLLEAAKKDRVPAAAAAAGRNVVPTGFFSKGRYGLGATTIPNYPIEADAREKLVNDAYEKLLAQATPQNPHPVALIELPSEKRVLVAELGDVASQMKPDDSFRERARMARSLAYRQGQDLVAQWFRADAVKARLGYRSADPEAEKKEKEKEKEPQNTEEAAVE